MTVEIIGRDRLLKKLAALPAEVTKSVKSAVATSAIKYESELKKTISQGGRSGKLYKRKSVIHQASAPGQPPKTDTGTLVESIAVAYENSRLSAKIFSNLSYARSLEFGTSKMAARPAWHPLFIRQAPEMLKRISTAVNAALQSTANK